MEPIQLFAVQTTLSFVIYSVAAKWYVLPRLKRLPLREALIPLVSVHLFRHIGATLLAPGATDASVPIEFRAVVAYGDLLAMLLALASLVALRYGMSGALALVWTFNLVGVLDLISASLQGVRYGVFAYPLGVGWLIVTFYVPALWVTSILMFYLLFTQRRRTGTS